VHHPKLASGSKENEIASVWRCLDPPNRHDVKRSNEDFKSPFRKIAKTYITQSFAKARKMEWQSARSCLDPPSPHNVKIPNKNFKSPMLEIAKTSKYQARKGKAKFMPKRQATKKRRHQGGLKEGRNRSLTSARCLEGR
jgi:hypothetical protein